MPRDISIVLWRSMHSPSDKPRAVTTLKQDGNLSISHHPSARDSQNDLIDFLEYFAESVLIFARPFVVGLAAGSVLTQPRSLFAFRASDHSRAQAAWLPIEL